MRKRLESIGMDFEKNVTRVFHGGVTIRDANRMRITLDYDFKSDKQLRDWSKDGPGRGINERMVRRVTDGRIRLAPGEGKVNCLRMNAFDVEVYEDKIISLAQREADMVSEMTERAKQPGSVTEQRQKDLQKWIGDPQP